MSTIFSDPRAWLALLAVLLGGCLFALVSARCQRCRERKVSREAARIASQANAVAGAADSAIRQLSCAGALAAAGRSHRLMSDGIARLDRLQNQAAHISARCDDLARTVPGKAWILLTRDLERLRIDAGDLARMRADLQREVARLDALVQGAWSRLGRDASGTQAA